MDSVKDLLSDQKKGCENAQGILCFLFRRALLWRRVTMIHWNKRAAKYFEKPHNKNKPVDKGNLNKALITDDMTWGSFVKGIDFLGPVKATFDIVLSWPDKTQSVYSIVIDPAVEEEGGVGENDFEGVTDIFDTQSQPVTTLARLYRHILFKEDVTLSKWNGLVDAYIENPLNGLSTDPTDKTGHASTLKRSVLDTKMSWTVFRRGIKVLNPVSEVYTLRLYWTDDPVAIEQDPISSFTECTASFSDPFASGKINERVKKFKTGPR